MDVKIRASLCKASPGARKGPERGHFFTPKAAVAFWDHCPSYSPMSHRYWVRVGIRLVRILKPDRVGTDPVASCVRKRCDTSSKFSLAQEHTHSKMGTQLIKQSAGWF